jgi:hypothetical protein
VLLLLVVLEVLLQLRLHLLLWPSTELAGTGLLAVAAATPLWVAQHPRGRPWCCCLVGF